MVILSNEALQDFVESQSLTYFKRPFSHLAVWNKRLRSTGGRYHLNDHHLDFNPRVLADHGWTVFAGIVRHELCHYHLHLTGKGYRHSDQDFKDLLQQVEGLRHVPSPKIIHHKYHYRCLECGQDFWRQRRLDISHFVCGNCRSKIHLIKQM
ncbi:SprT family protein [Aerococcus urinaehominis]|uniref:SprT family protein n=1 Tax=Aerococcus urinaehominis TaxID=128944 RepID=A0A0X8FLD6_9LACT|nr:SprT family protein [Aerococcus urinaehominis]AMB98752.1 SprT family protein [Aerococcus urinaehominis]SDM14117.1 SprT-like protein [Aerococcus urinaehominis]